MIESSLSLFRDSVSPEISYIFLGILSVIVLVGSTCLIFIAVSEKSNAARILAYMRSWWYVTVLLFILVISPSIISVILISYVSYIVLREMLTVSPLRTNDRSGLFIAYLAVPIQYYFAWNNHYTLFLIFIPLIMFILIPFVLVLTGDVSRVGRSMSIIPAILLLTVFMLSHMVMIMNIEFDDAGISGKELIVFLVVLTSFNDIFQYSWSKLIGKRLILPNISPKKTWEGFIAGVISTAFLGYFIRFLTPFNGQQAFLISFGIGIFGFIGDALISAIKRDLKLKDTSNLIPGHGRAMDRLDALFMTAPMFYHVVYLLFPE